MPWKVIQPGAHQGEINTAGVGPGWSPHPVIVAVSLGAGYHLGVHTGHTPTVRTGVAWSSGYQAEVTSHGVVYNVPLGNDSDWYGQGSEHLGGTPVCLPPLRKVVITFATVSFYRDGAVNSTVVWVRC
jgi:hypothetical protein